MFTRVVFVATNILKLYMPVMYDGSKDVIFIASYCNKLLIFLVFTQYN